MQTFSFFKRMKTFCPGIVAILAIISAGQNIHGQDIRADDHGQCGGGREDGMFYRGNDIARERPVASGDACSSLCQSDNKCNAWSYHGPFKRWRLVI